MAQFLGSQTPPPSSITRFISDQPYLNMLENSCSTMRDLRIVHAQLIKTGFAKHPIAASRLLAFSASPPSGDIHYAYSLFTRMPTRNLFVWNTMIRGFSESSTPHRAISLFVDMLVESPVQPDCLTYPSVFKAYSQLGFVREGSQLHGRMIKLGLEDDRYVQNTVLHMYSSSGFMSEARRVFDRAKDPDVVAWNILLRGVSRFGDVDESRELFDGMRIRSTATWNSMIGGYVRAGRFVEALELFGKMQAEGVRPDEFTMVSLLNACGCLGTIRQGEWIHQYIMRANLQINSIVVTALIDMYSKCGSIGEALRVFREKGTRKGLSCWNSMIIGLAMNGREFEAVELFAELESSHLKPDNVSFIAVLMACNHAGLIGKAKDYFLLMTKTYKIKPSLKHYSCMVDALGRAGRLLEAEELIRKMPMDPDAIIWSTLLSWCRKFGYTKLAERAAECVEKLDPSESSSFVILSNLYASSKQFEDAVYQRAALNERRIQKQPGSSSIEVNGEVHEFLAGGSRHPLAAEIYSVLDGVELGAM